MGQNKTEKEETFSNIESLNASLTEYIVYGTHLNIKGKILDRLEDVKNVNLVMKSDAKEEKIELEYNQKRKQDRI